MQAIVTTFSPDDSQRPAIKASCMGKSTRIPYDPDLGLDDNHVNAALALARLLGWVRDWTYGRLSTGDYCHVAVNEARQFTTRPAPSTKSPPETWRGRGGISTARRR